MTPISNHTLDTGKTIMVVVCEDCGHPASYIDTSGKMARAWCGMRNGKFVCKALEAQERNGE